MSDLVWLVPALAGVVFLGALWKLANSGRRLITQVSRAEKAIRRFLSQSPMDPGPGKKFIAANLDLALRNRKSLVRERAKAKSARQRRLVKRLKSLSIEGKRDKP